MPDQLLSTDPKAGRFLSDDPKAGTMPPPAPTAHIGPIADDEPVTLGDIQADPVNAMRRIGVLVKKDVTNPRLWLGLAAGYFGPKVFGAVAPTVARAAARVEVNPGALLDFKVNQPLQVLRSVRIKPAETPSPEAMIPGFERYGANVSGTPPTAAAPEAVAAPVAPAASVPAAPGRPPAPVARTAAPESTAAPAPSGPPPVTLPEGTTVPPATAQYYPQKFLNEVALQAKREGLTLSDGEYAVAHGLTEQGATPAEAVRQIGATRAATAPPAAASGPAAPKLKLAGQEQREYLRLRNQGLSHQQAEDLIVSQRALSGSLNLPSGETVRQSVAERNATGRWGSDQ